MSKHQELLKEFGYLAQSARTADALMDAIVQKLHDTMTRYNWVGFYLVDKTRLSTLNLGPHVGSFEPHESVSLDKGSVRRRCHVEENRAGKQCGQRSTLPAGI